MNNYQRVKEPVKRNLKEIIPFCYLLLKPYNMDIDPHLERMESINGQDCCSEDPQKILKRVLRPYAIRCCVNPGMQKGTERMILNQFHSISWPWMRKTTRSGWCRKTLWEGAWGGLFFTFDRGDSVSKQGDWKDAALTGWRTSTQERL